MTKPPTKQEGRFSAALVGGFQNIRFGSALVVSVGWTLFLVFAAQEVSDFYDESSTISLTENGGDDTLLWFGAFIAFAYTGLSLLTGWRKPSSTTSAFFITVLFAPMTITSFALGLGHAFDSQFGDILCIGSGVLNLAVIVASWLISTNTTDHPVAS